MDEDDEEPFSAANSAVVAQSSTQDGPRRPQPGGRFPSDIAVAQLSQRGLQAPLSPSSGSSGYGDVQDRDVAAASALPGSGVGEHYAHQPGSPTHAQLVKQQAHEDGVNPYTYERLDRQGSDNFSPPATSAASIVRTSPEVVGAEVSHIFPTLLTTLISPRL